MENQRRDRRRKAGLPVKRETGQEVVCRVSEPKGSLLFDIVNERKRSAGGRVLAVLVGNHRDNQKHKSNAFRESNKLKSVEIPSVHIYSRQFASFHKEASFKYACERF